MKAYFIVYVDRVYSNYNSALSNVYLELKYLSRKSDFWHCQV